MTGICLSHAWDIPEIPDTWDTYDMPERGLRNAWDMPEICLRYAWDMSEKCLKYALYDLYDWYMPGI